MDWESDDSFLRTGASAYAGWDPLYPPHPQQPHSPTITLAPSMAPTLASECTFSCLGRDALYLPDGNVALESTLLMSITPDVVKKEEPKVVEKEVMAAVPQLTRFIEVPLHANIRDIKRFKIMWDMFVSRKIMCRAADGTCLSLNSVTFDAQNKGGYRLVPTFRDMHTMLTWGEVKTKYPNAVLSHCLLMEFQPLPFTCNDGCEADLKLTRLFDEATMSCTSIPHLFLAACSVMLDPQLKMQRHVSRELLIQSVYNECVNVTSLLEHRCMLHMPDTKDITKRRSRAKRA